MLGSFLGFRVKYVEKEEYSKTIGVLTGLKEEVAEEASVEETSGTDNAKNEEIPDEKRKSTDSAKGNRYCKEPELDINGSL